MRMTRLFLTACYFVTLSVIRVNAEAVPHDFLGVWIAAGISENQCKPSDWKGPAQNANDRITRVTPTTIEGWEHGCKILNARIPESSIASRSIADVSLLCSGEGMTWRSKQRWFVKNIDRRKLFLAIEIERSDERDDSGRRTKSRINSTLDAYIYLDCN